MSVRQTEVVDYLGLEQGSGHILLTLIDDLDWSDEHAHLVLLQDKLNKYLAFIESGEVYDQLLENLGRRVAPGTPVKISVLAKYPSSAGAERFLGQVRSAIEAAGFAFAHKILETGAS